MVYNLITCCAVTRLVLTTHGMRRAQHKKTVGSLRPIVCDRAIPNDMFRLWEAEPPWSVEVSLKRMGLLARGAFGEMVERANPHHSAYKEPLRDPSYANQGFVDNNI